MHTGKWLSENAEHYRDAATFGIRQMLGLAVDAPIPAGLLHDVRMGTTVATNALLERKGERVLLLITEGFGDLLAMGHLARPRLFDLDIRLPQPLYAGVEEVRGRVDAKGETLTPLDETILREALIRRRAEGFSACAIALIHAFRYPDMEAQVAAIAAELGYRQITTSHGVSTAMGLVARASTAVADAYLSPVLHRYVEQVEDDLGRDVPLSFMRSDGVLAPAERFDGRDAILSGPAGGIVGAARTAQIAGEERIIAFDMGGTSTDIALFDGELERRQVSSIAGIDLCVPMMAIDTIAAGGGSVLHWRDGRMMVGPDSAGANPGPVCYRRGGPLTMTDANLLCGKISPAHFPALFGADGAQPLDQEIVAQRFVEMAQAIGQGMSALTAAEGFLQIGVAAMASAIKRMVLARGQDVRDFTLQCFGGAGGQHACLVADELGMRRILIHPLAGVLSAFGMGLAELGAQKAALIDARLEPALLPELALRADALGSEVLAQLGHGEARLRITLALRYEGTDTTLDVAWGELADILSAFTKAHLARFGFVQERAIIVSDLRAEATLVSPAPDLPRPDASAMRDPLGQIAMWTKGRLWQAPILARAALPVGACVTGPAMLCEELSTTVIEPGWQAQVLTQGELLLTACDTVIQPAPMEEAPATASDPVLLELYAGRFMALAEQMGSVLQSTATSINMRERLDFSCALFDAGGQLIANAPHVPVHLGAMGESVRAILSARQGDMRPGDAFVLNNPFNGGTHLPDITVITPLFDPTGASLRGFVANRGHHADIGGMTPGSTPPFSQRLEEEGVVIDNFLLLRDGDWRERELRALLADHPWPARNPDANLADLRAQVAANAAGARDFAQLCMAHGWPQVSAYMSHVLNAGEAQVREALGRLKDSDFATRLDDGRAICVALRIDHESQRACFDFTGTGAQDSGNFNAPRAVTRAVVLYALRCLIGRNMPLNDGCLRPVDLIIPPGSFLDPDHGRAVVAGNTEISQQLVNALLLAMGLCAGAQGTMNNLLLGNARHQYYETIGGGTGAGAGFAGAGPVQAHMTNTRITDPEVLECRIPVRLERFAIRHGSGGNGQWRGGNGALREITVLEPMTASLVTSARDVAPAGMAEAEAGAQGRQWHSRAGCTPEPIKGRAQIAMEAGDTLIIETPGGGGYGPAGKEERQ